MSARKKLPDESPPIPLDKQPTPKRGPKDTKIAPKFTGKPKSTVYRKKVNEKQLDFIENVLIHGNASKAYRIAYPESSEDASRSGGSRLLAQPHIRAAIDELMKEAGFNDDYMDAQLLSIIDKDADNKTRLLAIKHYNEITGRSNHTLDVHVSPKFDLTKLTDKELDTFLKLADKSKS